MSAAEVRNGELVIPTIDISIFRDGSPAQRAELAAEVDRAASGVGFMQVIGHGIPAETERAFVAALDQFFGQDEASKRAATPGDVKINRGYSGPKSERLSYSLGVTSAADLFEAFNVGVPASSRPELDLPPEHYPENIWPAVDGFRDGVQAWFAEAGRVARELTAIFAAALHLPAGSLDAISSHSIDMLRLNNYHISGDDVVLEPGQMGMGAHTDYGIVTVLWADTVKPGLQVLDANGGWHDVVPAPGALLVNLGDALARWTNDRWISTMHRVLAPIDDNGRMVHRRSAAYFHDGNFDAVIECLPGCSDAAHPPLYEPTTVGAHIAAKLAGSRAGALNTSAQREAQRLTAGTVSPS